MSDSALRSLSIVAGQPGNTGSLYQSVGSDVYFFVSGSRNTTNPTKRNVSVFGGDLIVSGNLKVDGCDLTGSFSFDCDAFELTGSLEVQGKGIFTEGISGSLTRLSDGSSYLIAGNNIAIASASNGSVTISSTVTGGSGDANAEYLVLSLTGSLTSERRFVTGSGLITTDLGPGSDYIISIDDSIVATVSGTTFTGATKHITGLSGSLTKLADGTSYLVAGNNVTITSASNGAVTINSTATTSAGGANTQVQFNSGGSFAGDSGLTYNSSTDTLTLVNLAMTASADLLWQFKDNSAGALNIGAGGSNYWTFNTGDSQERLGFWDGVRASFGDINDPDLNIQHDGINSRIENKTGKLILSSASGLDVSGSTKFANGLSGSLTRLVDGTSYLIAGAGISITSSSSGAVTITNDGTIGDITAVNAGTGLTGGGTSGAVTLNINDSVVATVSGTIFTGDIGVNGGDITTTASTFNIANSNATTVQIGQGATNGINLGNSIGRNFISGYTEFNQGLSGSLTKLIDGTSYIRAGANITVTSASNGSITIEGQSTGAPTNANYLLVGGGSGLGQLSDERTFIASTGLTATDGGANGNYTLTIDDSIVATVSGTTFTGATKHNSGLSGSLTKLTDGTSYLIAGSAISIASASNGAITISSTAITTPGGSNTHVQFNDSGSFGGVSGFAFEKATNTLTLTGGVTGSNAQFVNLKVTGTASINVLETINQQSLVVGDKYITLLSGAIDHTSLDGSGFLWGSGSTGPTVDALGANAHILYRETLDALEIFPGLDVSGSLRVTQSTTITGSLIVSSSITAPAFSGSLTKLTDGTSYLIAGSGISIVTGSSGAITITNDGTVGDITSVNAGTGLSGGGTSGAVTLSINDSVVATVSGTTFTGDIGVNGGDITTTASTFNIANSNATTVQIGQGATLGINIGNSVGSNYVSGRTTFNQGLSGSLTKLSDGTSYLIAGDYVTITTGSSGAVTITGQASGAPTNANYLLVGGGSGGGQLSDERTFVAGTGLTATDGGANGNYTLTINDSVVATVSGTTFTGAVKFNAGLSGSLTKLVDGTSYIIAGDNILITSTSNGSITITGLAAGGAGGFFTSTTPGSIFTTGSTAFRGSESSIDSPSDKGTDVFFYVSGSTVTDKALFGGSIVTSGSLVAKLGLSGSLTKLSDGTSAFIAGNNVTITSSSNGAVTIASAPAAGYAKGFFYGSSQDGSGNIDVSIVGTLVNGYDEEADVDVFKNGQLLTAGANNDYTVPANNTIHFNTTLNPDDVITVRLLTTGSTSSGGNGTGNAYTTTFTNASLIGGVLTVNHGLTSQYIVAAVYDNNDYQILPDEIIATSVGVSDIDLSSFGVITGTWKIVIIDGSGNAGDITSVVASTGLSGGGTSGAVSLAINDSIVATVSGTTFTGVVTVNSSSNLGTIVETMSSSNGGTGVVNFSIATSSIFYVNNPAGNITANFTGAPTTNDRIISTTVILSQSSTARIVSGVQVDGVASTINWANGITPTGNANKQDVFGFTLIRSGSAWKTLGQMNSFG